MKYLSIFLLLLLGPGLMAQDQINRIRGQVTDGRNPIANVAVGVEEATASTFTDENGRYRIEAPVGAILKFSYQGMKTLRIQVEDVTRILNPAMAPDINELDEVVLIGSNRKSQKELAIEYPTNERLIRTAFGILNADTAPGNVRFMTSREITPVYVCILDLLRNRFSGVRVQGDCTGGADPGALSGQLTNIQGFRPPDEDSFTEFDPPGVGKVFVRGANSIYNQRSAIFDVDGQIFQDAPLWLDINQIKRMAILNNFASATAYGQVGSGGVIVINTISGNTQNPKIVDQARLRNNYVSGKILSREEIAQGEPTYLLELKQSNSLADAQAVFDEYKSMYGSSPYFFIDTYRVYAKQFNALEAADAVVENHMAPWMKNPVILKALAYSYQEQGRFDMAKEVFSKVLKLRPSYGQSYLDLANAYRDLKDYDKAASLYTRYEYMVAEGLMPQDSMFFNPIISREYNNLLFLHKNSLVAAAKSSELFIDDEPFQGTRLVFEWNDGEAEFDLQFVNPDKQYFKWEHSLVAESETIMKEKALGYNAKEFLLDDSYAGNWSVNLKYFGNKSLTPTYLKVTIYDNYGTYSQSKQVQVFKLQLKDMNQQLFQIRKNVSVVMN